MEKTEIVLDADVLIHFSKGGRLFQLPNIIAGYKMVVLDIVYNEITTVQQELQMIIKLFSNFELRTYAPTSDERREYARLLSMFGRGESACMAYCRFNHQALGSSNLRDIKNYCEQHNITYLTTLDFLYIAWRHGLMTTDECHEFIAQVRAKGSKLPQIDIETYACPVAYLI